MKYNKIKEKGITLIALVVTIVLLLILAGVTISQITGENGLIRKAKEAVERYKNASEEEQIQLGQLEQYVSDFSIVGGEEGEKATISIKSLELTGNTAEQKIIVKVTVKGEASGVEYKINSEEEWTKKVEELEKKIEELENEIKSIKPSSIKANSILMNSGNSELNLGIYNLSKFSNTFNGNFNSYFTYNQTTGEIVCKEDGWYCINLDISLGSAGNYSRTTLEFFINNTLVEDVWGYGRGDDTYNVNSSSCQVYMIKGDTLKFEKNIEFDACTTSNATIALIKI